MGFNWVNSDIATTSITIYETNFTLNKIACQYFEEIKYVLVGYDSQENKLAIKPVTKEEKELGIYPSEALHKISIGKSYGRISNKQFIKNLANIYHFDFTEVNAYKFEAQFDFKQNALIIDLNKEESL